MYLMSDCHAENRILTPIRRSRNEQKTQRGTSPRKIYTWPNKHTER